MKDIRTFKDVQSALNWIVENMNEHYVGRYYSLAEESLKARGIYSIGNKVLIIDEHNLLDDDRVSVVQIPKENRVEAMAAALAKELKVHDWYHQMSDDHKWYVSGLKHREKIDDLYAKLYNIEPAHAVLVWNKYAPDDFKKIISLQ